MMQWHSTWGWPAWSGDGPMVVCWLALAVGLGAAWAFLGRADRGVPDAAGVLLRGRHAAGELTDAEFARARRALSDAHGNWPGRI